MDIKSINYTAGRSLCSLVGRLDIGKQQSSVRAFGYWFTLIDRQTPCQLLRMQDMNYEKTSHLLLSSLLAHNSTYLPINAGYNVRVS
jgi:hypothetical protein